MKFSEAIRLGAMLNPQGRGRYRQTVQKWFGLKEETRTCAMGAAVTAMNCPTRPCTEEERGYPATRAGTSSNTIVIVPAEWSNLLWTHSTCPACAGPLQSSGFLHSVIAHLNDNHEWTREQIADWVQQFEPLSPAESEVLAIGSQAVE